MKRIFPASVRTASVLLIALLRLLSTVGHAQSIVARQELADALNQAISGHQSQIFVNPDTIYSIKRLDGGCDTLVVYFPTKSKKTGDRSSLNAHIFDITLTYGDGIFTLCIRTSSQHVVPVPVDSHPLVRDLNTWLDAAWGLDLQSIPALTSVPFFSGCANSVSVQPFFRGSPGSSDQSLIENAFLHATAADAISMTSYTIMGEPVLGSTFLDFLHGLSGIDNFGQYIADRVDEIARTQYLGLKFMPPGGGSSSFFSAQTYTDSYSSIPGVTDCGLVDGDARLVCAVTGNSCGLEAHFDSSTVTQGNQGLFDYFRNDSAFTSLYGHFGNDDQGWLTFTFVPNANVTCSEATTSRIMRLVDNVVPDDYCCMTFQQGGQFVLDTLTGQLVYRTGYGGACGSCCSQPLPCLQFCYDSSGYETLAGVIDDYAQTFADRWTAPDVPVDPRSDDYEVGRRGHWRTERSFRYKTTIISGNYASVAAPMPRNYTNAGVFDDFTLYNWRDEGANAGTRWLKRDSISRYSSQGDAVEQVNALGVYNSAVFGYRNLLPTVVAQNAPYGSVSFESFEDGRGNAPGVAHSGRNSHLLTSPWTLGTVRIVQQDIDRGLQVRFWAKDAPPGSPDVVASVTITPYAGIVPADAPLKIAQSGDWALYEQVFPIAGSMLDAVVTLGFEKIVSGDLWLDDIRVQPLETQMNCYVYDPSTFRVATIFDDQHFGLYFQYNGEGKLVRKIRETERGMKTLAETQYHTPLVSRSTSFGNRVKLRDAGSGPTAYAGSPSSMAAEMSTDSAGRVGAGGAFDLLDVEIGPDAHSVTVLGSNDPKLPSVDDLHVDAPDADVSAMIDSSLAKLPGLDGLPLEGLTAAERAAVVEDLTKLDMRTRALLKERDRTDLSAERKAAIDRGLEELRHRKNEILRERLGMSDEEIEQWYRQNREEEK